MLSKFDNEEDIVFTAVQDYLNDNRILEKNNLINYIKSYFSKLSININEEGIIKNLESLIKQKKIVEGSKLTKDTLLENSKRKKIYEFILENSGIYFNKIVKKVNMSNHVVYWHLNMLLKFNFIKTTNIQNHDIYYDSRLNGEEVKIHYLTNKKESKKIIDYLSINRSGIKKTQLADALKMHPKTIKKYVGILFEFGLIEKKKYSPKEILYFLK
ncbi:MAG: hypothetical protein ACFE9Z_10320 [Promethearchaeota archaeon]